MLLVHSSSVDIRQTGKRQQPRTDKIRLIYIFPKTLSDN